MGEINNTYFEGMDRDTSFMHYGNKRYYEARNMRPTGGGSLNFTKMAAVDGNTQSNLHFSGQTIIGAGRIRDKGIFITTSCTDDNPGGVDPDLTADATSNGKIYYVDFTYDLSGPESRTLVYSGNMNITTKHPINDEIYCYYDNEDVQKIYFADHFNLLRHINIEDPSSTVDKLDIVSDIDLSQPYLESIGTGNLDVGVVQYAYQLYDLNGGESVFSSASPLYTISESNEFSANTKEYKGSAKLDDSGNLTNSGKSFNIQIDNIDTDFDKIKIVSIHYNTVDSTPTINVVSILDVASSVNLWDSGSYELGTITLTEFRTLGGLLISPKTLAVKDNILFAGNIKQKYFDVDFDARAYRYRVYDETYGDGIPTINIWHTGGATGHIFDRVVKTGTWPNATFTIGGSNVSVTHNCINPYNYNPDGGDASPSAPYNSTHWARHIFQSDGSTIGGEGPNVKYEIKRVLSFATYYQNYDGEFYVDKASSADHNTINSRPNPVSSYGDSCNPYMKRMIGYKRNEIYRFGIVFFNDKGQQSYVKWIGDIKMPTNSQFQFADGVVDTANFTIFYDLCVDFYVENLPSNVVGYQIVRVKREEKDKTIVASGIVSHTVSSGGVRYSPVMTKYKTNSDYTADRQTLLFISPEVNYYKNLSYNAGDILWLEGTTKYKIWNITEGALHASSAGMWTHNGRGEEILHGSTFNDGDGDPVALYRHQHDLQISYKDIDSFAANEGYYYDVQDGRILEPNSEENYTSNTVTINGVSYTNYSTSNGILGGSTSGARGPAGTKFVLGLNTSINTSLLGSDAHDVYYVDYIRNNANIIYGGLDYEDRQLNEYIPAGEYVDVSTLLDVADYGDYGSYFDPRITVFGGDTFINVFEHLMTPQDGEDYDSDDNPDIHAQYRVASWVRFPCESSVNLPLTHGSSWWRGDSDKSLAMRETAGEYYGQDYLLNDYTFGQDEDMYLYNSVYSQSNTSKVFFCKPDDFAYIKDYDTLIYYSDTKASGSEIDAWLKFRVDNSLNIDSSYGEIQKLFTYKSYLLFMQDKAFGMLSSKQRQLLQTENQSALELGTGNVLNRFEVIQENAGCKHPQSVVVTDNGVYWYDVNSKSINRFAKGVRRISTEKSIHSYIKSISDDFQSRTNIVEGDGIIAAHNIMYDEVLFTFKDSVTPANDETIVFNELLDKFTGFYDLQPLLYYNYHDYLITSLDLDYLYVEDTGYPAQWFGTNYDIVLILIINPNNGVVNVFNNFEYYSRMLASATGNELNDNTWDRIQMENSYQDSGEISVTSANVVRRIRMWRFKDFRDSGSDARFRDVYLKLTFKLDADAPTPDVGEFYMNDFTTYISIPAESENK